MTWLRRHRYLFLIGMTLLALVLSLLSDPDHGLSTALGGLAVAQGVWALAMAFWARKALMDYPEADQRSLFARARETATGAGLALIACAIMFLAIILVFAPRAHATEIPQGFLKYGFTLKAEQEHYWPSHPQPYLLPSLVEQESCTTLHSHSCWNPSARLKSAREEGAGMGQITRAFRPDGSIRFDALADMRRRYSSALGDWSWGNVYTRPDLQLRAIVLMSHDAAEPFREAQDSLKFGDAAYNGGIEGVQRERRACALSSGCDARIWFGNVEAHCLKSRQPLYGNKNACDINREHVHNVFLVRAEKYKIAWGM